MAIDIFLKFGAGNPGTPVLNGRTQDSNPDLRNAFEISSLNYNFARPASFGSQGGGAKVSFAPIVVTLREDRASLILKALASGSSWQKVTLYIRKAGGGENNGFIYETITLSTVFITQMQTSFSDDPQMELSLTFGAISFRSFDPNSDGGNGQTPDTGGWNQVTNKNEP